MKRKLTLLLAAVLAVTVVLWGCADDPEKKESVVVYDGDENKICVIENQAGLDYIRDIITEALDSTTQRDGVLNNMPSDAKVKYHYWAKSEGFGKTQSIDLYTYSNYHYITIKAVDEDDGHSFELTPEEDRIFDDPVALSKMRPHVPSVQETVDKDKKTPRKQ